VPDLKLIVSEIADEMRRRSDRGTVAHYIPELATVDPSHFGIAVVGVDGTVATGGDFDMPFSIQSVSKVFTLTLALGKVGDRLWSRVGREPSGSAFNSIVQLEYEKGIPRNPFINPGAIAVTDLILSGHQPREALGEILRFMRFLADDPSITIDEKVAASEQRTGFRNAALANYMKSFGVLDNPVELTLGVYYHQCAIAMSCLQLANAGRFLAMSGRNPATGHPVIQAERARRHQCGDADLRPLRWFGGIRLPRRPAGQETASAAAFSASRPARPRSRYGRRGWTPPATRIWGAWRWKRSPSAWAGRSSARENRRLASAGA